MSKKNWKIARRILVGLLAICIVVTFSISRSHDHLLKATSVTEDEMLYEETSAEEQGLEENSEEIVIPEQDSGSESQETAETAEVQEEVKEPETSQEPQAPEVKEQEPETKPEQTEPSVTEEKITVPSNEGTSDSGNGGSKETSEPETKPEQTEPSVTEENITVPSNEGTSNSGKSGIKDRTVKTPEEQNLVREPSASVKAQASSSDDSISVAVGSSVTLDHPSGYSRTDWESSNTSVAQVSDSGVVTGLKEGTVTITYRYRKSSWTLSYTTIKTYTVTVTKGVPQPSISISPGSVTLTEIGETKQLRATLKDISNENTIVWTSSDKAVATVENGEVKAVSAGTCTITASVSPEEDELYGETYTASASVEVEFAEYDLYHYGLIPGASADNNSSNADSRWFGLGVSKILGVKSPTSYNMGTIIRDYTVGREVKPLYPDLQYGGVTYKYAPLGSENAEEYGYYTLQPFRVTVSSGANAGYNSYNTYVKSGVKSYHLDYICVLNEKNNYSVNFAVLYPQGQATEALTDYAQRVKEGTALSSIRMPSSTAVPQTMTNKGINYVFDGWYTDPGYTQKTDFSGNITGNLTLYGRYVATNARYRIEYYYDGVLDESQTVTQTADLGAVISSYSEKPRTGFTLSEVEPSSITVTNDESKNVIRVYYTKRLVTYKVGYYLNGTDELISPQITKSVKFGETGTGELKEIDGYTPVSDEKTKTQVIEGTGTEIRFYYYKNVTLSANSGEFTYDGTEHSVSGYTSSEADAVFEDIEVSRSEKNAGNYKVSFPDDVTGMKDSSSRYIVTDVNEGKLVIKKADVSVKADNTGKKYKAEDPELTATVTGAVAGEEKNIEYTLSREEGEQPGTYEISVSGEEEQGNYNVSFINGEFEITRADDLRIFVTGYEGIYDGGSHGLTLTLSDEENTKVSYSTDGGETWTEDAPEIRDSGEIKVLVRAENPGYDTAEAEALLKVSPKEVTVKASDQSKVYGEEDPQFTATVTGTVGNEEVSYTVSRTPGEDAGTYDIVVSSEELQGNYTVKTEKGSFEIRKKTLTLDAVSKSKLYDGETLTGGILSAVPEGVGLLFSRDGGETWTDEVPYIRNAGTLTYTVRTESGNYETAYSSGTLSIGKRTVILTSESAEKEYDGNRLRAKNVEVTGDGFAPGEGADFDVTGSRKNVGSSENTFTYTLKEGTSPKNYNISQAYGTLTVKNRSARYEITVRANDGSFLYDGSAHSVSGIVRDTFEADGNTYTVSGLEAFGEGRDAGEYTVSVTGKPVVKDDDGNDVTDQFAISVEAGKLTVLKRSVTLTSSSMSGTYSGNPLTTFIMENKGITVGGDGFSEGEGVFTVLSGSQTVPGSSDNTFEYTFMEGTDPSNYDISTVFGILTVTNRGEEELFPVTVRALSEEAVYDGKTHKAGELEGTEFTLNDHVYHVEGLKASQKATDAGNYPVEIKGTAKVVDEKGRDVTSQFRVETIDGTLTIHKRTVIMTSSSLAREYDGTPLTSKDVDISGDGFADSEGASFEVTGSQTVPGSSPNTFTYSLKDGTKEQNYNIETRTGTLNVLNREAKFEVAVKAAGGSYLYDGTEHSVSGFSLNGGETVNNEDTSFSLMGVTYTLSGLSAEAKGTDAGTYTSAISGEPKITDSEGNDVTDQFIINSENGNLNISKRNVILTSASASKEYDGTELTADEVEISGDGFAPEEGADFDVTGAQQDTGISENTFTYELQKNTDEKNYSISVGYGTLEVTNREAKYEVSIEALSGSFLYDGKTKRVEGLKGTTVYADGNYYTVTGLTASGEGVHAGTYPVNITGTAVVTDGKGNDVTDQFAVRTVPGTLEITKRSVVLTSASASQVYDGSSLRDHSVSVTGDGFSDGEGASYEFTGTRTLPGISENTFTYTMNQGTLESDYNVTTSFGVLEISGRSEDALYEVHVKAQGGVYLYDGELHEASGFTVNGGEICENGSDQTFEAAGHTFTLSGLSAYAGYTAAGSYDVNVTGTYMVTDSDGNDVTSQFRVVTIPGKLVINKRNVVLTSGSSSKEYDGSALTDDEVTVGGDGFCEGEGATFRVTGRQMIPGTSENSFTYTLDPGTDSANYDISVVKGKLEVLSREAAYHVSVSAGSGEFTYDGNSHSAGGVLGTTVSVEGKTYTISGLSAETSAVHAGTYPVRITGNPVVTDSEGNDVTSQFSVETRDGSLVINRRNVILISDDSEKIYDGSVLKGSSVTVSGDGFCEGEGAEYTFTGSQTVPGISENSFTYSLKNGTSAADYDISSKFGKLQVNGRPEDARFEINVSATSGEYVYDGTEHIASGFTVDNDTAVIGNGETAQITASGHTYSLSGLTSQASLTDAGTVSVNVAGTPYITDEDGNDVTSQFIINYENGELKVNKRQVTLTSGSKEHKYNGKALTEDEITVSGDSFVSGEGAEYVVTGSQTIPGSSENTFTYTLNEGTKAENYDISTVFGRLTVFDRDAKYAIELEPNSGSVMYDGMIHGVEGFKSTSFKVEDNYYTVTGMEASAEGTHAGTYPVKVTGNAIVLDSDGNDVTAQFSVRVAAGELTITKRSVTLTSESASKIYDGSPLTNGEVTVSGDGFVSGDGAAFNVSGTRTIPGIAENRFAYVLNAGTLQGDYDITCVYGALEVTNRPEDALFEIEAEAIGGRYLYDGKAHEATGFTLSGSGETYENGAEVSFECAGNTYTLKGLSAYREATDAGTYSVNIVGTPSVTDSNGNDVTAQFLIRTKANDLVIDKRKVVLTSGSASKEYDGSPVANDEITVTGDGFCGGEGVEFNITGSQTLVGSLLNQFTYTLTGAKAENYDITTVFGLLDIFGREDRFEVQVEAKSGTFLYDGKSHEVSGLVTDKVTVGGKTYTVTGLTAEASAVHAGKYAVKVTGSASVLDSAGNDVTDQFKVNTQDGVLEITRREVRLTSQSASKVYDGDPVTNEEITVTGDGFSEGEGATYEVTGSRTLPGASENTFTYSLNEGTQEGDYRITVENGLLEVSGRPEGSLFEVRVKAAGGEYLYDGEDHRASGYTVDGADTLVASGEDTVITRNGHEYTVKGIKASQKAENAGTYPVKVEGDIVITDDQGNDVTSQFRVITEDGTLQINRRSVALISGSDSKTYDGEELSVHEVKTEGDGFVDGEGASYDFKAGRTIPGISENVFTYTLNEGTLLENYDITTEFGKLEVKNRSDEERYSVTVTGPSQEYLYDGETKKVSGFMVDGDDTVYENGASAEFTADGKTYTVSGLSSEVSAKNSGAYPSEITGDMKVLDHEGNDVTDQFVLITNDGSLKINRRSVVLTSQSASKVYDGDPLKAEDISVSGDGFVDGEGASFDVTGRRTLPGTSDNLFTYTLNKDTEAANYDISTVFGRLEISDRAEDARYEIDLTAQGGNYLYDGTEHVSDGYTVNGSETVVGSGETASVTVGTHTYSLSGMTAHASAIDAGTYRVNITGTPQITDEEGNDVTKQFLVKITPAELKIERRSVILTSGSASREYDGTALTMREVTVTGDGFSEGEDASYTVTGQRTITGISENRFTYELTGKPENYDITVRYGKLEVLNRDAKYQITVTANSGEFLYDGAEHEVNGLVTDTFTLEGNTYTVSGLAAGSSAVHAGEYPVTVTGTAIVKDADGNDVTDQFMVNTVDGSLKINKRRVTMTSGSSGRIYNGAPLTSNEMRISGDGFIEGEGAAYTFMGSRTLPGASENIFRYVLNNGTLESDYIIDTVFGSLEITNRPEDARYEVVVKAQGGEYLYDGTSHQATGLIVDGQEFTNEGPVTLDCDGFEYTLKGLTASRYATDAGTYAVNVTGTPTVLDKDGNDVTDQFIVRTEANTLKVNRRSVILTSGSGSKEYDGEALTNGEVTVTGDGFIEGEDAVYSVTGTRTLVGSSENTFTYTLNAKVENYDIRTVFGKLEILNRDAKYQVEVTANSGEFLYDGEEHEVTGLITDTVTADGNTYTVSGLAAQAKAVHAGEYTVNVTGTAVVTDAEGNDVTDQFAVSTVDGSLKINKRRVTMTSGSSGRIYNGAPLTSNEMRISGDGFAPGEGAAYTFTGSRTLPGASENIFRYVLNNGTLENDYIIDTVFGSLEVTNRPEDARYEIVVKAQGGEYLYDGTSHQAAGLIVDGQEFTNEGPVTLDCDGFEYTLKGLTASRYATDAGTYAVNVTGTPTVLDAEGHDVTDQFIVRTEPNTLTIQKRSLILTSASDSKEYDGDPLTNDEITVSGDGFIEGEDAVYSVTGTRTLVGSSENTFTYTLNAKVENYDIRTVFGKLEILNRDAKYQVEVTANSGEFLYDGESHEVTGLVSDTVTADGKTYTVSGLTAKASAVHAGEYPVTVTGTAVVTDQDGNDVTDQFAVSTVDGSIKINRRTVTLTSEGETKTYDGDPLKNENVTVSGDGFAEGEGVTYTFMSSRTLPGTCDNTFSYTFNEGTVSGDYDVETAFGVLEVTDRLPEDRFEIHVKAPSGEYLYDGAEHELSGIYVEGYEEPWANGDSPNVRIGTHIYTLDGLSSSVSAKDSGTYPVEIEGTARIEDESGNDVTSQFIVVKEPGTLKINRRTVTLTSGSASKEYDGEALTNEDMTIGGDGFIEGEGADFTFEGSQLTVGRSDNGFTYALSEGTDETNYDISVRYGKLEVVNRDAKYQVTVTANSGEFLYDGEEHEVTGLITDTVTADGNTYSVSGLTAEASAVHAGEYPVTITGDAVVTDEAGNDVTDQFAVSTVDGLLRINRRTVTLTSESDSKTYDGDPLKNDNILISGDGFTGSEGASYDVTGERTRPGTSENTFTYTLKDGTDQNDYIISREYGTLEITGRPDDAKYEITVKAVGGTFLYDGTEHTAAGFTIDGMEFSEGSEAFITVGSHRYTVSGLSAVRTATDSGTYTVNVVGTPVVSDETGYDVTDQFIVKTEASKLVINRRSVTLTSASDSKEYDGSPLTNEEVTVSGDGFCDGEGAEFTVTGTRTLVGSSENTFSYILDGKAENYDIRTVFGKLQILNRDAKYQVTVTANSGKFLYDGEEHEVTGLVSDTVTADGKTYTVSGLTAEVSAVHAGEYTVNVTGVAKVTDAEGNDVTDQFAVTTVDGLLKINKRTVGLTSESASKVYDGDPLRNDKVIISGDGFSEGEGVITTVTGSRTVTGTSENTFTYVLGEGTSQNDYNITVDFGTLEVTGRPDNARFEITVKAVGGTFLYDGTEHTAAGFTIDGMEFSEGSEAFIMVGSHRYTVSGLSAVRSATDSGTYTVNVVGTPVVSDETGYDVTDQFIVKTEPAKLVINRRSVTLTSASDSKEYDGSPLTNEEITVSGDGFCDGEGAEFTVTGTRTLVGSSENTFSYILDGKAENYDIRTVFGKLQILNRDAKYQVTVTANSGSFLYDGEKHEVRGLVSDTVTADGKTYTVSGLTAQAKAVHAGEYTVAVTGTAVVTDADGNDVTDQFAVNTVDGTMKISKRAVTLTSESASKVYDGDPLRNDEVLITGDGFSEGEGVETRVTGVRTLPGMSDNIFTYTLKDGTDQNDYIITVNYGTLEITGRPDDAKYEITVKAVGGTFLYDGTEHTAAGFTIDGMEFSEGSEAFIMVGSHRYTVSGLSAVRTATDSGTYTVNVVGTPVVSDETGYDVTDQFIVKTEAAKLVINRRSVTLTSASDSKEYDGSPLTNEEVTVSGDGFCDGEGAEFNVTGTRTLVGSSENTFSYILNGKAENYDIRTVFGKLQILNRDAKYQVIVTANSGTFLYDGEEHEVTGLITDTVTADGKTYTVSGLTAEVSAVHAGEYTVAVTGTAVVTDSDGNDVTDQFAVNTVDGTMKISKRAVTLTSESASKVYDGDPLKNDNILISGDGFSEGEGVETRVTGVRTLPGMSDNIFTYTLKDGTDQNDYIITVNYGTLEITSRPDDAKYEVVVTAGSGEYLYDGTDKTQAGISAGDSGTIGNGEALTVIVDENEYSITGLSASRTALNAGSYRVNVEGSPVVTDRWGNDVTDQFRITSRSGALDISKRDVTLTSGSASHAYTGKPLRNEEVTVSGDGFASSEGATYDVTGYQTLVGISENYFAYTLGSGTSEDNYNISKEYGTLEVTNRDARYMITVTANSGEFLYDGEMKSVSGFTSTSFTMDDVEYTVEGLSASAEATDAGEYAVHVTGTPVVLDQDGNDVTDQFAVTVTDGLMRIRPRHLVFTSNDASFEYDGEPHSKLEVTVTGDGFSEGEGAEFRSTQSGTLVGTYENSFEWSLNEGTKPENYVIDEVFGILSITDRDALYSITLRPVSDIVEYDGKEHTIEDFEETEFEIEGNIYTVENVGTQATGTEPGVYAHVISGEPLVRDENGNDVTDQFAVTIESGTLTIVTRSITITPVDGSGEPIADPIIHPIDPQGPSVPVMVPAIEGMYPEVSEISIPSGIITDSGAEIKVVYTEDEPEEAKKAELSKDEEEGYTLTEVVDEELPLTTAPSGYWAVINLILAILTALLSIIFLIAGFFGKKKEEDEDGKETKTDKHWLHRILGIVIAVISCIIFIVTEDMSNTMAYTDRWTILMAIILIVDIVILVLSKRKKKEEDPEEETGK